MIISHTNRYIYLQPVGMDAHVGDIVLRNAGLVDANDVCSALYLGDIELYPAQNFTALTLDQYKKKFELTNFVKEPDEQIMTIINASLTINELVDLGYITPKQVKEYSVFSFLREPVDRFVSIFTESQVRRPIPQSGLDNMFRDSMAKKFTHLLWQDQHHYHMYKNKIVSHPLIYDKFYYSIEKMVNSLGGSLNKAQKLRYTYSLSYSIDPVVANLAKDSATMLRKIYNKDQKLWEQLNDHI